MDRQGQAPLERALVALGDGTRRRILLGFYEDPAGRTVDQVAAAVGVHRTVAFQHLERLAALGYLATDRRRGVPGKPAKVYHLAEGPVELSQPARLHRQLAGLLATALGRFGGAGRAAGREVGMDFGRSLGRPASGVREALAPLEALGGRYALEPGATTLVARNCVFQEACRQWPEVVCGVHAGTLEGLLGAAGHGRRVGPIGPRPDGGCAFALEKVRPPRPPRSAQG
jgi:predicted ArsR family transcriptional regulator